MTQTRPLIVPLELSDDQEDRHEEEVQTRRTTTAFNAGLSPMMNTADSNSVVLGIAQMENEVGQLQDDP